MWTKIVNYVFLTYFLTICYKKTKQTKFAFLFAYFSAGKYNTVG
jgi:hypothetical protein